MNLTELITHPERLDRDTLYELRSLTALYPYFQNARLLMLQNLYLLHDPTFDEELRRAAIYVTDRRVLFDMIEARHYMLRPAATRQENTADDADDTDRTVTLIENFLDSIPGETQPEEKTKRRKPTPADAATDYVAWLLENEQDDSQRYDDDDTAPQPEPILRGQHLIDNFIAGDKGKIVLSENPTTPPPVADDEAEENYFTETLARIYIKQGRYSKALEIIKRLSLEYPGKNAYFADQIRFLEKIISLNNITK